MSTQARVGIMQVMATAALLAPAALAPGDVVIDWNQALLQAIRETGGGPCPMSRKAALVHVSIYEAVNSITKTHEAYNAFEPAPAGASLEAAVASAAHAAMAELYPGLTTVDIDALYTAHLDAIADGPSKDAGIAVGAACMAGMMELRADDGSDNNTPYEMDGDPGDWKPTPPNFAAPHAPNWPLCTPCPSRAPISSRSRARRATPRWSSCSPVPSTRSSTTK